MDRKKDIRHFRDLEVHQRAFNKRTNQPQRAQSGLRPEPKEKKATESTEDTARLRFAQPQPKRIEFKL
jgi:hypothetical protein